VTSAQSWTGAPAAPAPAPLDRADLRRRIGAALAAHLDGQARRLAQVGEELAPVAMAATDFVMGGGKRLRPAFAYWGWRGAGGAPRHDEAVVRAVSCLELLHACALVHDDVMDASDIRRGAPAVHRRFAALHRASGWSGSADGFGEAAAILVGDLCLIWADGMLHSAGLPPDAVERAVPVYDDMRTELMAGQYLDVLEQVLGGRPAGGRIVGRPVDRAMRVARFKSGRYTVERPLQLGAAIAGAGGGMVASYSAYGIPLGEAFQLRDDVLGVFGDPVETGKPAGDDLREGKRTVLVALAVERAAPAQAEVLRRRLGDPRLPAEGVAELRTVIAETGALAEVERMVGERTEQALAALAVADLDDEARTVLRELAVAATARRG